MPNINPEHTTVEKPQEVEEAKTEPKGLEPEPKNPNTVGQTKREFRDGGYRSWDWQLPLADEPMWQLGRKVLGLSDGEASQYQNEIADVMKLIMEYLQSDDEMEVAKFLRRELRFTPNSGNRIFNLLHNMVELRKEQDDES